MIEYFLKCHLNDLIAPIFILALSSVLLKWIDYELKELWIIMLIGVFAGIVWEFVTPLFKTSSVADLYDFLCYVIGTMIYYGIKKITIK